MADYVGLVFFFQAEDGIRDLVRSRGLGDVYKRQGMSHDDAAGPVRGTPLDAARVEDFARARPWRYRGRTEPPQMQCLAALLEQHARDPVPGGRQHGQRHPSTDGEELLFGDADVPPLELSELRESPEVHFKDGEIAGVRVRVASLVVRPPARVCIRDWFLSDGASSSI